MQRPFHTLRSPLIRIDDVLSRNTTAIVRNSVGENRFGFGKRKLRGRFIVWFCGFFYSQKCFWQNDILPRKITHKHFFSIALFKEITGVYSIVMDLTWFEFRLEWNSVFSEILKQH